MTQETTAPPSSDPLTRVAEKIRLTGVDSPSTVAVEFEDQTLSWGALHRFYEAVDQLIQVATPGGGTPRIVLVTANRPTSIAAVFGLLSHGWPFIVVSSIQPKAGLAKSVADAVPDIVLADGIHWSPELLNAVEQIDATAICLEASADDEVSALLRRRSGGRVRSDETSPTDSAVTVTTSGTTGTPKPITMSWRSLPFSRRPPRPVTEDGKPRAATLHALPLATVGGLMNLLLAVERGRPIVMMERIEVTRWSQLVHKHKLRRAGLPPAAMRSLLDAKVPPELLSSLEEWPTGSARLAPELKAEFERTYGIPVLEFYGATEFGGEVAGWTLEMHREWSATKSASVGRVSPGNELRVVDPVTGDVLEPGVQGLLEVKPRRPPVNSEAGWVRTNDLARLDADGFLYIDGRADDVIVRGGFKVPLAEVEDALRQHPGVSDAAVLGLDDARLGQVPAAAVVLKPGQATEVDSQQLLAYLREHLAPYKLPTRLVVIDELPRTESMKVSRPVLRRIIEGADPH